MRVSSRPVTKTFYLKTDPEGAASISFTQATFGAAQEVAELTSKQVIRWNDKDFGQTERQTEFNYLTHRAVQIYLTCTGIDGIQIEVTAKNGDVELKPMFEFTEPADSLPRPKDRARFMESLGKLAPEVVSEMYEYCLEMNPQWGTSGE